MLEQKYYDEDPSIYNGEEPYNQSSNFSIKYDDVRKFLEELQNNFNDTSLTMTTRCAIVRNKIKVELDQSKNWFQ